MYEFETEFELKKPLDEHREGGMIILSKDIFAVSVYGNVDCICIILLESKAEVETLKEDIADSLSNVVCCGYCGTCLCVNLVSICTILQEFEAEVELKETLKEVIAGSLSTLSKDDFAVLYIWKCSLYLHSIL